MSEEKSGINNEASLKVNFFGLGGVGKTTIINRLLTGEFKTGINFNLKLDVYNLNLMKNNEKYKVNLWEIVGAVPQNPQTAESIYTNYLKNCKLAFCVFSVTDKKSLIFFQETINYINLGAAKIILLGNKNDLVNLRELSTKDIQEFTNKYEIEYIEISALDGLFNSS